LTATEAVMRCRSGATLAYRRQNEAAPGSLSAPLDTTEIAKKAVS
jgi:hypothetical protein